MNNEKTFDCLAAKQFFVEHLMISDKMKPMMCSYRSA